MDPQIVTTPAWTVVAVAMTVIQSMGPVFVTRAGVVLIVI